MADKLRLGTEVRELKIGQSFTNTKSEAFHTIRYDFKPASVDINKIATVDVGTNNQVTVTVPHLDGAGVPQTVFKGSRRPFQKECVLIIDRVTGEITLEKLSSNMQVKKTRSESTKPQLPQDRGAQGGSERSSSSLNSNRPATPPIGQRQSNKTRVTSGSRRPDRQITHLVPKHSPLHASPNPNYPSPGHHKSPKRDRDTHTNNESHSALASLPLIGEDFSISPTSAAPPPLPPPQAAPPESMSSIFGGNSDAETNGGVGEMSDTSSSDSSSDSDSDHDSGPDNKTANATPPQPAPAARSNGHSNGGLPPGAGGPAPHNKMSMPTQLLNEDLCLSESGSDSD